MKPTLIYGAGGLGKEMLRYLVSRNRVPSGFIDQRAATLGTVDGVSTWTLSEVPGNLAGSHSTVVIAVHNFMTSVGELRDQIFSAGFEDVLTLWEFCQHEKWLPENPYWLSPHFDWRSQKDEISQAYHLLEDHQSKKLFSELLALRQSGNYSGLSAVDSAGQYMPQGLPPYEQPVRLIDCGAFDGDTIRGLIDNDYEVEEVMAFEPDPDSFAKLNDYLQTFGLGTAINAGTHVHKGALRFSNLGTGASHLDTNGDISISVECIDDLCSDFPVTLIKMDVEGAEADSLNGAQMVIEKYRPVLAISVYHKPADLWSIPLMINQFDLDYRFYLRTHGQNGFDTVLYAYPR
jgi:FkbM family methyltransferase